MHKSLLYHQKSYAETYDQEKFAGAFGQFLYTQEVDAFLSLLDTSCQTILDGGAGTGKLSIPLALEAREVIALDSSPEMLHVARARAEPLGITLRTVIGDIEKLNFDDCFFDGVTASRVLMHLSDWRQGLAELCRVSRHLVIVDFSPWLSFGGVDALLKRSRHFFNEEIESYRVFSVKTVRREFEKNNFNVVEAKRLFFLPIALHRQLDKPQRSARLERFYKRVGLTQCFGAPVVLKAVRQNLGRSKSRL